MSVISPPSGGALALPLYQFSEDQYRRLLQARILHDQDRLELRDGFLVAKGLGTPLPEAAVAIRTDGNGAQALSAPLLRCFTVEEYHRMIQGGILDEEDPVELLEGWLVLKMPHNPPHDSTVYRVQTRLWRVLPADWLCRIQSAVTMEKSEPEPDLAVARGPENRYDDHHPTPQELALVVEVADSTLARDRQDKGSLYARNRVSTYWIVNLVEVQIEVYTDPSGPGTSPHYRQRHDYGMADTVPLVLAGQAVAQFAVRELLPRKGD